MAKVSANVVLYGFVDLVCHSHNGTMSEIAVSRATLGMCMELLDIGPRLAPRVANLSADFVLYEFVDLECHSHIDTM
jgi:hypothetical protein